jgi:Fe-S cluster assembly protein SufD
MTRSATASAVREVPFASIAPMRIDGEPEQLQRIRAQAAERFNALGLPTTRLEEWKYTSLAPLGRVDWQTADIVPRAVDTPASLKGHAVAELLFVNGRYAGGQSLGDHPSIRITPLAQAVGRETFTRHFSRYADYKEHAMTALNTALFRDGAFIEIAAGTVIEGFIHLLFVADGDGGPVMANPRNLIVAGSGSQVTIVESFTGRGTTFTNTVTEIVAGDGAVVEHIKIECESAEAFHVGTVQVHQERSSSVSARSFALGGALVRNETNVALTGEGASLLLDGLFVENGRQHIDNHTVIDHARPHCDSLELYKGILDESARGIFDGRIIVRPDAQKTASRQTNHNLLLSETAIVDSKPTLEIHNDDVKCNHGSTIGQLDEEALFYLRARGIGDGDARSMLVYAFAGELLDRVKIEPVREQIRRALYEKMSHRLPDRREEAR